MREGKEENKKEKEKGTRRALPHLPFRRTEIRGIYEHRGILPDDRFILLQPRPFRVLVAGNKLTKSTGNILWYLH